jgi:osmoprotectant transport system ATP-binding protein
MCRRAGRSRSVILGSMAVPRIALEDVTCRHGAVTAVDSVSMAVAAGEVVALVGASGSGKTTTLRTINRLIEPSSGTVRLDGEDVRDIPAHLHRRGIGYVFQRPGLFPHLTIADNVAIPLDLAGLPRDRVRVALEAVELGPELSRRYPHELSGGQQQRAGVARAIVAEPAVMLLDEPFGALDPLTRDRVQQMFLGLRRSLSLTAVFVTHDMAEALFVADRIGVMRAGRLVQLGTPQELVRSPLDAEVEQLLDTPRRQAARFEALRG